MADALDHYLQQGSHNQAPSALFDAKRYVEEYPDVKAKNNHPLVHFLKHGKSERRWARPVIASGGETQGLVFSGACEDTGLPNVACMVHAFYSDVFDDLAPLLVHLPSSTNFFISVADTISLERVITAARNAGIENRSNFRVLPNRGRNFGAFLDFSEEILKHEVVLHVHTKRSLYTGRERNEWRQSLLDSLLGSKALVQLILESFARHPELGLYHPATFEDMPYWAHHWLSNAGIGAVLLEKLGIAKPAGHYFSYPVGGMFWARVEAIRPLLALGLGSNDFPEEAGQTDGTLAHALERAIGLLPASLGFQTVQLDASHGFRTGAGTLNMWQYGEGRRQQLSSTISTVRLVSFDIFDTLLVRPCLAPDSALAFFGSQVETRHPELAGFFNRRRAAETQVRQAKRWAGDVSLKEIYAQLAHDSNIDTQLADALMTEELALEQRMLRPREGMREVLAEARMNGHRVIVISDTYFPQAFIEGLFDRLDLRQYIDQFYLSCECNARKDRGDLWDYVARRESVDCSQWLHIGDNEQSDIQACSDRRIHCFHVMHPGTVLELTGFQRHATEGWAPDLALGPAMLAMANSPFTAVSNRVATLPDAEAFGFAVFGPLVLAFTGWLASHPALPLQNKMLFLSREGFLLQKAYELLRSHGVAGLPPSEYFYTSRRAALSAVQAIDFDQEFIINGSGYRGTFGNLLNARLGFKPAMPSDLGEWEIMLPQDADAVLAALELLRDEIVDHAAAELALLKRYCAQTGITANGAFGVVDIGYSGTIQRCLQTVVPASLTGFYFATFSNIQKTEDAGGHTFGYFSDFINPALSDQPLVKQSFFVESFLTATHGQVRGYEQVGEALHPVFKDTLPDADAASALQALHAGALRYIDEALTCYGPHLVSLPLGRGAAQEPLRMYAEKRVLPPPGLLDALHVEDDFTGRGLVGFKPVPSPHTH